MRIISALVFTATLLAVALGAPVEITSEEEFNRLRGQGKDVLVKFYADWCGHCKSFAAPYASVADEFAGSDKVIIAKLNAPNVEQFARAQGIRSFPTLYLYKAGQPNDKKIDYKGDRTTDAVTTWLRNQL